MLALVRRHLTWKLLVITGLGTVLFAVASLFAVVRVWDGVTEFAALEHQLGDEMAGTLGLQQAYLEEVSAWNAYLVAVAADVGGAAAWRRFGEARAGVAGRADRLAERVRGDGPRAALSDFVAAHAAFGEQATAARETGGAGAAELQSRVEAARAAPAAALAELQTVLQATADARGDALAEGARADIALGLGAMVGAAVLAFVCFLWVLRSQVTRPLDRLVGDIGRLAGGDFTEPVRQAGADEVGRVTHSAEQLRTRLGALLGEVREANERTTAAATRLRGVAGRAEAGARRQAEDTDQVATAMNQMSATVLGGGPSRQRVLHRRPRGL